MPAFPCGVVAVVIDGAYFNALFQEGVGEEGGGAVGDAGSVLGEVAKRTFFHTLVSGWVCIEARRAGI